MKKLISFVLGVVLMVCLVPCVFAAETFSDMHEGVPYFSEVQAAKDEGFVTGFGDGSFHPNIAITRAELVTILGKMYCSDVQSAVVSFEDVPTDSYYAPYVSWVVDKGYLGGWSVKEFMPDAGISVEQLACLVDNYISKTGITPTEYTEAEEYADKAMISAFAESSMELARKYGIIVANADGCVHPQAKVTRAEAVAVLMRLYDACCVG